MIPELPPLELPTWLRDLSPENMARNPFPLRKLLKDSLYYPASGFDGDPVRWLAGNFLSFIYVDYGNSRAELLNELRERGFLGYRPVGMREVSERELTPKGWKRERPTYFEEDPGGNREGMIQEAFCQWFVFERGDEFFDEHGPERFSLLYLCADGVAAFQALYLANGAVPKAVAVIQPGHAFGGNYTDFTDPEEIFARNVLGNPKGIPEYLIYGGFGRRNNYRHACWRGYESCARYLDKTGGGTIGVWQTTR